MPLRVAAISFLNPAPLLYHFEHAPEAARLREDYALHYTLPAECAAQLLAGEADLGLIPVAALTPELTIVPGCTIASLDEVRSILLLVKNEQGRSVSEALGEVRTLAADTASRSSVAYARILFEHFHHAHPIFCEEAADPLAMLAHCDAALLIGDPALLAREARTAIDAVHPGSLWLDLAEMWRSLTGLPWVAAVWAVRPESLGRARIAPEKLIADLCASRDAGLAHIDELVREWTPRIAIPPATIEAYLTRNIYYTLDAPCLEAVQLFRNLAANLNALPRMSELRMLG